MSHMVKLKPDVSFRKLLTAIGKTIDAPPDKRSKKEKRNTRRAMLRRGFPKIKRVVYVIDEEAKPPKRVRAFASVQAAAKFVLRKANRPQLNRRGFGIEATFTEE